MKLGKKAPRFDPRTLRLAKYTAALNPPPAFCNWTKKITSWPMMLNDQLGDCTCACAGHMIEQWTGELNAGRAITPPDSAILTTYEAVGGYVPGDPSTDNGAVILDVLNYWRKTGIGGSAPEAYNHRILAFASLEPNNHVDVMDSIYIFGNSYIGVQLPLSAQGASIWEVPPGGATGNGAPGSWGGHAVPIVAYDARGLTVVTWGQLMRMTWPFLDAYCDEAYAVLSTDWLSARGLSLPGFDRAQLEKDLAAI